MLSGMDMDMTKPEYQTNTCVAYYKSTDIYLSQFKMHMQITYKTKISFRIYVIKYSRGSQGNITTDLWVQDSPVLTMNQTLRSYGQQ